MKGTRPEVQGAGEDKLLEQMEKGYRVSSRKLRDLMPEKPRHHDSLPEELKDKLVRVFQRLQEVPYMQKQEFDKWQERFCYSPEPGREIAVWEWIVRQYEERTADMDEQSEKNRVFKKLLSESVNFEPLGVRKLPEGP
jgi:hypothetical protein